MKRFVARPRYHLNYKTLKILLIIIIFVFSIIITIKVLFKNINNNKVDTIMAFGTNNILNDVSLFKVLKLDNIIPENLFNKEVFLENSNNLDYTIKEENFNPIVYIYNTHQSEEYSPGSLKNYNITPTVFMASNILKSELIKYDIDSIVEEENIKDVLNNNNWTYKDSYEASKIWLNRVKEKYPNVKYFIDLHRDSSTRKIDIDGKTYAKLMFVIGMNHENYKKNESLMISIHNDLEENYNGIMRDLFYAKKNKFNQNFDSNVILVEVGGPDNTIDEVYNSILALAKSLANIIGENGK